MRGKRGPIERKPRKKKEERLKEGEGRAEGTGRERRMATDGRKEGERMEKIASRR